MQQNYNPNPYVNYLLPRTVEVTVFQILIIIQVTSIRTTTTTTTTYTPTEELRHQLILWAGRFLKGKDQNISSYQASLVMAVNITHMGRLIMVIEVSQFKQAIADVVIAVLSIAMVHASRCVAASVAVCACYLLDDRG